MSEAQFDVFGVKDARSATLRFQSLSVKLDVTMNGVCNS